MGASWRSDASGSLIVTAALGQSDFAWLDALRHRHYPPDRNRVPAHLTLFRSLPPSSQSEVRRRLARASSGKAPAARIGGVMDLDGGAALKVSSQLLADLREELAREFHGLLSAQDSGPWTPHVTIQNKVEPRVARKLVRQLREAFEPRPLKIAGFDLVRYSGGKWQPLAAYRFR